LPNEILPDQDAFLSWALAPYSCAVNHVPGRIIHLAIICVFGVHRLPASALKFLLLYAADKRLRTYRPAGDDADLAALQSMASGLSQ
jgi:hypothetical protein